MSIIKNNTKYIKYKIKIIYIYYLLLELYVIKNKYKF